jgi:hypothetical protein
MTVVVKSSVAWDVTLLWTIESQLMFQRNVLPCYPLHADSCLAFDFDPILMSDGKVPRLCMKKELLEFNI